MPDHEVLLVDEAADYLRTSRWTLYALVRRKVLPERRHGMQLRFFRADLDNYLARRAPLPEVPVNGDARPATATAKPTKQPKAKAAKRGTGR